MSDTIARFRNVSSVLLEDTPHSVVFQAVCVPRVLCQVVCVPNGLCQAVCVPGGLCSKGFVRRFVFQAVCIAGSLCFKGFVLGG